MSDETAAAGPVESPAGPQVVGEPGMGLATAEERIGAKLAQKEGVGLDPAMIIMMIQAVITAITNCKKPTPATLKRRSNFNRATLGTAIRQQTGCDYRLALSRADGVIEAANEATDQELDMLIRDCAG